MKQKKILISPRTTNTKQNFNHLQVKYHAQSY